MKRFNIIAALVLASLFFSCSEDKLETFDSQDNVIFGFKQYRTFMGYDFEYTVDGTTYKYKWGPSTSAMDTLKLTFVADALDIRTKKVYFPLEIMGSVQPYDRPVNCVVVPEKSNATQGEDYTILDSRIPAGQTKGAVIVEISRENLGETEDGEAIYKDIEMVLLPNEHFVQDYPYGQRSRTNTSLVSTVNMHLTFDDALTEPSHWYKFNVGYFSREKATVLITQVGVPEEWIFSDPQDVSPSEFQPFRTVFERYLRRMQDAGTPVREANGALMSVAATMPQA